MMCRGVGLLGSILFGTFCASWTCMSISFTKLGNFPFIICSNKFLISCCCSSPSGTPMIWMLECLKLSWRHSSFFWILVSSFCYSWMFISSFCSKLLIWVPVSFPSLLVPCIFSFISLCTAFIFFLYFATIPNNLCEHPDYQCFELYKRDRLAISFLIRSISGVLICSFI